MINSRSHTHLPPPDTSAKTNHCPLILSYCPLVHKSTTKSSIQVVAWEVTNSIMSAWPAKYLFTNSLFKTDQGVTRSRHGSFAFQYNPNCLHIGWTHPCVRHPQLAACTGNTSVALKQERGVTASPWLEFCVGHKWKLEQCNLSSQLWFELKQNWSALTSWHGRWSKKGFLQRRAADQKTLKAKTVTPRWVVKNDTELDLHGAKEAEGSRDRELKHFGYFVTWPMSASSSKTSWLRVIAVLLAQCTPLLPLEIWKVAYRENVFIGSHQLIPRQGGSRSDTFCFVGSCISFLLLCSAWRAPTSGTADGSPGWLHLPNLVPVLSRCLSIKEIYSTHWLGTWWHSFPMLLRLYAECEQKVKPARRQGADTWRCSLKRDWHFLARLIMREVLRMPATLSFPTSHTSTDTVYFGKAPGSIN